MEKKLRNECIAEFIGTFLMILLGVGCVAAMVVGGSAYDAWEICFLWGLSVALAVYVTGAVSGAHLNPSVTIALAVFGGFPKSKIIPYIIAQMLGSFTAALVILGLFSSLFVTKDLTTASVFATFPHPDISLFIAFMSEFIATAVLLLGIFALTDDNNGVPRGAITALLIGLLVAVIGGTFGSLTGFALNAARDFPPRLLASLFGWGMEAMTGGRAMPYVFIPLIAPILGGLFGAFIYKRFIAATLIVRQIQAN